MENLICCQGLRKSYGSFVLEDFDLSVCAGQVVGLVGSNGAGKTTALKCLLGLITPDEGRAELLGTNVGSGIPDSVKSDIGVVFDACAFPAEARVADIAQLGAAAYGSWSRKRFDELAALFQLEPSKKVRQLSRGMGMKLSLAFALAHSPRLLVLDEATAGLDPLAREEVLELLRGFMEGEGRGILMSSHITTDLEKIADTIVCLDGGRVVFTADKDTICDTAGIARLRAAEVAKVLQSGFFQLGEVRLERREYDTVLLVPDRMAFSKAFPDIAVERASIEGYMALMLKGEVA